MKDYISSFRKELLSLMSRNYNREIRTCICGCGKTFKPTNIAHWFNTRKCYARYHRLPGMVRKLMNEVED